MKKYIYLISVVLAVCSLKVTAQNTVAIKKIKRITEYNVDKKAKELDHIINFNEEGLKIEEMEFFSDGIVKTKIVYEYDSQKNCIKTTKYGLKGKVEKVSTFEFDAYGNKTRERTLIPSRHLQTDKIFEYSYY